jgi:hypothetical protein
VLAAAGSCVAHTTRRRCGRLGVPARNPGKSARPPVRDELEDALGVVDVLQLLVAEVTEVCRGGQMISPRFDVKVNLGSTRGPMTGRVGPPMMAA